MTITRRAFGKTKDGTSVDIFTLTNANGLTTKITNYGCIIVSIHVPDRDGILGDIVLGFDTLAEYIDHNPFFGCVAGRYANRIAKGRFILEGVEYALAQNDGENHLHGGNKGFDQVVWAAHPNDTDEPSLKLSYQSPDGEAGYPGNLSVGVLYTLTNENTLQVDYTATTDRSTVLNLTNHSYFNLAAGIGDILSHEVTLNADYFTPVDETLIPTGELCPVAGTPLDFTESIAIGARIDTDDEQLRFGGGYDHNWVLNGPAKTLALAARVTEPTTGRVLEVHTTQPGVQFYTGNMMPDSLAGKDGKVYKKRYGFCLETQHFPDSPNKPHFPSVVLEPGTQFSETTVFQFAVID